jgi:hypothetical protein
MSKVLPTKKYHIAEYRKRYPHKIIKHPVHVAGNIGNPELPVMTGVSNIA